MSRHEDEKLEIALLLLENAEIKKKNIIDFFSIFAKYHVAFIKEIAEKYKKRDEYPLMPTLLAEYYTNTRDIEFALLMTVCMKWDRNVYKQVQDMKRIIGDQPYLWLRNEEYKSLGLPRNQERIVDGYRRAQLWKVSQYAQHIYDLCAESDGFLTFEDAFCNMSLPDVIDRLSEEFDFGERGYRGRMLDLVFRTDDGIGKGLWHIPEGYCVRCPITKEIASFVKLWLPEYHVTHKKDALFTFDEAVRLYGFEKDCDFFYAWLGWKELCRRNPNECSRYVTLYQKRYNDGNLLKERYWLSNTHGIVPKVEF